MPLEILMNLLVSQKQEIVIDPNSAMTYGIDYNNLIQEFARQTGKVFYSNEAIKVRFESEGNSLDFSTLDNHRLVVAFGDQMVSPNKGGIDKGK